MANNRGKTTLRGKRRIRPPMQEFDLLPKELREWVAQAILPWSANSVRKAYVKALARTGDRSLAIQRLDRLQQTLVARDTEQVWESGHPDVDNRR